ncbi:PREDICTED: uncharacterized protein LOC106804923 [Priapulus caudatus]|uniref:Uncharacterized protein LOC106804923 n=1 Tax=Priapulus caudatus TaxID=37621 RepID=A0ABM1DPE6_PRICU|nr:PREDICTED: uncharacterized protein LOC106804923 [Priapulus caudatus]
MRSPARWIALVLVVWLIVVVYMFGSVYQSSSDDGSATHERIRRALGELDTLRRQNEELRSLIYEIRNSRHRLGGLEERIEDAMGQTLNEARDNLASRIDRTKTELHGIAAEKGFAPPPDSSDVETRTWFENKVLDSDLVQDKKHQCPQIEWPPLQPLLIMTSDRSMLFIY